VKQPFHPGRRSITLRLSALFALASALLLAGVGVFIEKSVKRTLAMRDLAQLCEKIELIRHVLSGLPEMDALRKDPHILSQSWSATRACIF
jgi:two-component system heavy metal sensor histidine kinase CusS